MGTSKGGKVKCSGDSCEIDYEEIKRRKKLFQGLTGESRWKLEKWMDMEPMDYDAPGSTVREQGV